MKKIIAIIALLLFPVMTNASPVEFFGQFTPSMGFQSKLTAGTFSGVNLNYRDVNPALDFSGDVIFYKGFGVGSKILYYLGDWRLSGGGSSISGDVNFLSFTVGPRYYYQFINLPLYINTGLGIGYYNTDLSTAIAGISASSDKSSFGFNWEIGLTAKVWSFMTVGGKFVLHYVADAGSGDDAILATIGPSIGVKF